MADGADRLGQSLLRVALGTPVTRRLRVHAGYALVVTDPAGGPVSTEHRAWQQALYPILTGGRASLVGRTRFEQRLLEGGESTGLRFRQLLRFNLPLGGARSPSFIAWHEAFLTAKAADWGPETGFDQHRSLVGFALPVATGFALEAGCFEQRVPQPRPDIVNRAFNLTLVSRF